MIKCSLLNSSSVSHLICYILILFTEVTSIRSGLRKRKRPESPQSTEPQVTEEWVDEDKLELWEIKQYGDRYIAINIFCAYLLMTKYLHVISHHRRL